MALSKAAAERLQKTAVELATATSELHAGGIDVAEAMASPTLPKSDLPRLKRRATTYLKAVQAHEKAITAARKEL